MTIDTDDLKTQVCDAIDAHREDIIDLAEDVQSEPELGYKEDATTRKVANRLEEMGLDVETELAITGARGRVGSGEFTAAVLGELDALVNSNHPLADSITGACHACGHHAQLANLIGTAYGFTETEGIEDIDATIEFLAVPAEEYLDLEYRRELVEAGDIEFFGGKQELIKRGYFDGIDCAAMIHAADDTPDREVTSDFSTNGFIGKFVSYEGRESHAGAAPEEGVNALNAALLGMNAIHAQRETFADEDHVRVHPILTKGGDGVNVVPAEVRMESYVRAKSTEAIIEANESVTRALKSGAMAVGATVEIEDYPGYLPLRTNETMVSTYDQNARRLLGDDAVDKTARHLAGSTDMGDVTQVVPGIHPWVGGFEGNVHSRDFRVVDEEMAYIIPAKLTACMLIDILTDTESRSSIRDAAKAKQTPEEYLERVRTMRQTVTGEYLS